MVTNQTDKNGRFSPFFDTIITHTRRLVNRLETAVSHTRLPIALLMMTTALAALGTVAAVPVIGSGWWYWSAFLLGVGCAVNLQYHWLNDHHFAAVQPWKLALTTAVHIFASLTIIWWLSAPALPPNSAAFITTISYTPVWLMVVRSYKR